MLRRFDLVNDKNLPVARVLYFNEPALNKMVGIIISIINPVGHEIELFDLETSIENVIPPLAQRIGISYTTFNEVQS